MDNNRETFNRLSKELKCHVFQGHTDSVANIGGGCGNSRLITPTTVDTERR